MTSKERVLATFAGEPVDRMPVTVLYWPLCQQDHFAEFTGRAQWELEQWLSAGPEDHLRVYLEMMEKTPFDIWEPQAARPRAARGRASRGGAEWSRPVSGHARDYTANQTQYVFDKGDVEEQVEVVSAREIAGSGALDYLEAVVAAVGDREFILCGGVVGTVFSCGQYVGQANAFAMMVEVPDLIEHLSWRIVEQNIEHIRALAGAGGDGIFIDDATATSDMISVGHYERFSLPYMREMVGEVQRLGRKAIVLYFGGVCDRLEEIASLGADGLSVECSMKGYVNDIGEIARRIGDRVTVFGNIDPIRVLQNGSEAELEAEIVGQAAAGRGCRRGFVMGTGSPITPATPLSRIRRFIELAHRHGEVRLLR